MAWQGCLSSPRCQVRQFRALNRRPTLYTRSSRRRAHSELCVILASVGWSLRCAQDDILVKCLHLTFNVLVIVLCDCGLPCEARISEKPRDEIPVRAASAICWIVARGCNRNYHRGRLSPSWGRLSLGDDHFSDLHSHRRV